MATRATAVVSASVDFMALDYVLTVMFWGKYSYWPLARDDNAVFSKL